MNRQEPPVSGSWLVLGAAGGIGSAVVRRLANTGHPLVLAGRDRARLEALDQPNATCVELDARDFEAVEACVAQAAELGGGTVLGIAHCIGSLLLKPAHLTSAEDWDAVLGQNLTSAFAVVRAAGKVMRKGGSVVLCSSAAGVAGLPNHEAIAAAKAGIVGLVRSAAATYAGRQLRFNAVAPGLVDTPLARQVTANPQTLEHSRKMHPLGRIGSPEEVAAAIAWLLDPSNSWMTGDVISLDGGLAWARTTAR